MKNAKVSIIVPARNEYQNLKELLPRLLAHGDEHILVDGHSTDGTADLAREHGMIVVNDAGKGKGEAIRCGFHAATGDVLVLIDADQSHDPDDIPRLIAPLLAGEADHVVGSRMRGGSDELYGTVEELIRLMGSCVITVGINLRFGTTLTESQNGFRALTRDLALALDLREDITTIEQEMTIKTLRAGYRMTEVPTHEYRRKHGTSTIQVRRVAPRYVYSWLKLLLR